MGQGGERERKILNQIGCLKELSFSGVQELDSLLVVFWLFFSWKIYKILVSRTDIPMHPRYQFLVVQISCR